ncbi:hypothetical protein EDB89DRAFT_2080942 [Lactarius sanguifluus]|nr:hypothetical protein EDB89DRAFT_2080942 [Lactarius sanguifluus]
MTINILPDNVFIEIFSLCRMDEVGDTIAHGNGRDWRMKNLGHLPVFPIVISFLGSFQGGDRDNLFAALEHRNRVRVVEINVPDSPSEDLVTVMQETFPVLTHLRLESSPTVRPPKNMLTLTDSFLGGSAPCLQTIHISGISFPAAPALLSSAHDLVEVDLNNIPPTVYISPEVMVATLATLPRLKNLTFEFEWDMSYPDRMHLLPITRTVLPALTTFFFKGLFGYLEDFMAQIDAPQLDSLLIEYHFQREGTDFQTPQLRKFIDRSDKLKLSQFTYAGLFVRPDIVMELAHHRDHHSFFYLAVQGEAIGQVFNQISVMLSDVYELRIFLESDDAGDGIPWLELFRSFPSVKALSVCSELSWDISLALENLTEDRAAEVLPALKLLYLSDQPAESVQKFAASRQNVGRPITLTNDKKGFDESLKRLKVGK